MADIKLKTSDSKGADMFSYNPATTEKFKNNTGFLFLALLNSFCKSLFRMEEVECPTDA